MSSFNETLQKTVTHILLNLQKNDRPKNKSIGGSNKYKIEIDDSYYMDQEARENKLAVEIAEALDDMDAILLHKSYVRQYSESMLREKLAFVLSIPKEKIRTSRAAYFNHLIQQHAFKRKFGSRH